MGLRLNREGSEVMCPHCEGKFGYDFTGEYGEVEVGIHRYVECPNPDCDKTLTVEVSVSFTAY